jgi:hypothetical protein
MVRNQFYCKKSSDLPAQKCPSELRSRTAIIPHLHNRRIDRSHASSENGKQLHEIDRLVLASDSLHADR